MPGPVSVGGATARLTGSVAGGPSVGDGSDVPGVKDVSDGPDVDDWQTDCWRERQWSSLNALTTGSRAA